MDTGLFWFYGISTTVGYLMPNNGSNGNEGVLNIPQSSRTGASPSDCLISYPGHLFRGGVLPLSRDAVSMFYSPSQLGYLDSGKDG